MSFEQDRYKVRKLGWTFAQRFEWVKFSLLVKAETLIGTNENIFEAQSAEYNAHFHYVIFPYVIDENTKENMMKNTQNLRFKLK